MRNKWQTVHIAKQAPLAAVATRGEDLLLLLLRSGSLSLAYQQVVVHFFRLRLARASAALLRAAALPQLCVFPHHTPALRRSRPQCGFFIQPPPPGPAAAAAQQLLLLSGLSPPPSSSFVGCAVPCHRPLPPDPAFCAPAPYPPAPPPRPPPPPIPDRGGPLSPGRGSLQLKWPQSAAGAPVAAGAAHAQRLISKKRTL